MLLSASCRKTKRLKRSLFGKDPDRVSNVEPGGSCRTFQWVRIRIKIVLDRSDLWSKFNLKQNQASFFYGFSKFLIISTKAKEKKKGTWLAKSFCLYNMFDKYRFSISYLWQCSWLCWKVLRATPARWWSCRCPGDDLRRNAPLPIRGDAHRVAEK